MNRARKVELDPNDRQATLLSKTVGAARFAYNWGLEQTFAALAAGEDFPDAMKLHRRLNALKKTDFPWLYEVSKAAPQEALRNLSVAWHNKARGTARAPRFKSRKRGGQSARLHGSILVEDGRIRLPRIGWVRLKERGYANPDGKILSVTVSSRAGRWFASVAFEMPDAEHGAPTGDPVGIDLGIRVLATLSDGTEIFNPRHYVNSQRKLRKLEKEKSRRRKGSNRRASTVRKIARLHYHIDCQRSDYTHKVTSGIVARIKPPSARPNVIVIEDLNVAGMLGNHRLAKHIADAAWGEFRRQLEYKAAELGIAVLHADRFYPSSRLCNACGTKNTELRLSDKRWTCGACGALVERDVNAALNLKDLAASCVERLNGRGDGVRLADSGEHLSVRRQAGSKRSRITV